MPKNTTKVWELSLAHGAIQLKLFDTSSLDVITRQLPQGFYSTFRTFDGGRRVLGLRAHLQRLYQPAAMQGIEPTVPAAVLRHHLAETLRGYPDEARIRVIMARSGQIYIALAHLKLLPAEIYSHGVKVITTAVQRQNPRLKSTTFITASESTRAQIAASEIFEALLVRNEFILEGLTSNFFYVKDGKLGTAREDILLGVTRRTILRVGRGIGLDIVYRPLQRVQVPALSEAFLTSSSRGIVPIIQINDTLVGEGSPGSITKLLLDAYTSYVMRCAEII